MLVEVALAGFDGAVKTATILYCIDMEPSQQIDQGPASTGNKEEKRDDQHDPATGTSHQHGQQAGGDIDEGNHTIADLGELGMSSGDDHHSVSSGDGIS